MKIYQLRYCRELVAYYATKELAENYIKRKEANLAMDKRFFTIEEIEVIGEK